ncbi:MULTISPECIES: hypothetical protein [Streptomyces]|uniref:hypothetical protein n=1 Tax=Streptomyces TaxID=1883 RepID=UPI000BF1BC6B|nr:hypothetical protein [Streptomyces sp. b84]
MTTAIPAPRTSAGADPVRPFKVGAYGFVVLGAALLLLPAPPIVILTVTSCAFALSLRRGAAI